MNDVSLLPMKKNIVKINFNNKKIVQDLCIQKKLKNINCRQFFFKIRIQIKRAIVKIFLKS